MRTSIKLGYGVGQIGTGVKNKREAHSHGTTNGGTEQSS